MTLPETTETTKKSLHGGLKYAALAVLSLSLIAMIAFTTLVLWVVTGPRSLKQFTPQISQAINQQLDGYKIELSDVFLAWNNWQSPLDAQFKDVKLYAPKGQLLAELDQVAVSASVWSMIAGDLVLDRITLYQPQVNIYRKPSGDFTLDLGLTTRYGPDLPKNKKEEKVKTLDEHLEDAHIPKLLGLNEFHIKDGVIKLEDTVKGVILTLEKADLSVGISSSALDVELAAALNDGKTVGQLNGDVRIPMHRFDAVGAFQFDNINPNQLSQIDPRLAFLSDISLPTKGALSFKLNNDARLQTAEINVSTKDGLLNLESFKEPLPIFSAAFKASVTEGKTLSIDTLKLQTADTNINGHGTIIRRVDEQLGIKMTFIVDALPTDKVANYWPLQQSPVSREWVTSNITGGKMTGAIINIDIKPGMLDWEALPKETIDANIKFDKVNVRFLPDFAPATNAQGVVHVTATDLNASIQKASFLEQTTLSMGKINIDNLNADNPNIRIGFHTKTSASELAKILSNPALEVAQDISIAPATTKGFVAGKADILFPFTLPRGADGKPTKDAYKYNIDASLQNVSEPSFLGEYDLQNVTGDLHVDHEKVKFIGAGDVFGTPLQIDVGHTLKEQEPVKTTLAIFGQVPMSLLKKFDVNLDPYINGSMELNANVQLMANDVTRVKADALMTKSQINIKELGWNKEKGISANITLVGETNSKGTQLSAIDFQSGDNVFVGSLALDQQGDLQEITATKLKLGDNNLQLSYAPIAGGYKIYAKGDYFDASALLDSDDNFSFQDIPALDAMIDIKKLVLNDGRYIDNLTGKANCNIQICSHVMISGNIQGAKPMVMKIASEKGKRRLKITTQDAGGLLNGLNVYKNMQGGKLDITGTFDDSKPLSPLNANLHIWDFEVYNTPTLARIITLASFGGLIDALQGDGLQFEKLKSNFILKNDVITVNDMRATGDSIGVTADGEINLKADTIAVKGVIIPSYTLNSLLKNVPIVGEILTGGEAIIAANYTLNGPLDDPKVAVNPLSALAPGFLRKIFQ